MSYHLAVPVAGLVYGVTAVVIFFLISGYVITNLIRTHYAGLRSIPAFFTDRLFRLCPQLLFYLVVTNALGLILGLENPFMHLHCSLAGYALNAALIPLNYWEFFATETFNKCMLISQSWTVGLETQIYLLLALLLSLDHLRKAFLISSALFILGLFNGVEYKWFIHAFPPATLFIFLCGSTLTSKATLDRAMLWGTWAAAVVLLVIATYFPARVAWLGPPILLGIALGIPALAIAIKVPSGLIDSTLGAMSYGVYLNHVLIILAIRKLFKLAPSDVPEVMAAIGISCFSAWLSYRFIELPVTKWRRARRPHDANRSATTESSTHVIAALATDGPSNLP